MHETTIWGFCNGLNLNLIVSHLRRICAYADKHLGVVNVDDIDDLWIHTNFG